MKDVFRCEVKYQEYEKSVYSKGKNAYLFLNKIEWFDGGDSYVDSFRLGKSDDNVRVVDGKAYEDDDVPFVFEQDRVPVMISTEVPTYERLVQAYSIPKNGSFTAILKLDVPENLDYGKNKDGKKQIRLKVGDLEELVKKRQLIFVKNINETEDEQLLEELRKWITEDAATQMQSVLYYRVFGDFQKYIEDFTDRPIDEIEPIEEIKEIKELLKVINFNEHIPTPAEYGKKNVQQIYMLVYGYMYVLNYYMIYKKLLDMGKKLFESKGIHVLSFGCGAKLDGMGMKMAIETKDEDYDCHYRGVDYAKWDEHGYDFKINEDDFVYQKPSVDDNEGGVISFLKNEEKLTENVFIFPTSISEFDQKTENPTILDQMLELMIEKIQSDHFYVATAKRRNQNKEEDLDRESMNKIRERLGKKFECVNTIDSDDGVIDIDSTEKEYNDKFFAVSVKDEIDNWMKNNIKYRMMTKNEHANFCIMEFKKIDGNEET